MKKKEERVGEEEEEYKKMKKNTNKKKPARYTLSGARELRKKMLHDGIEDLVYDTHPIHLIDDQTMVLLCYAHSTSWFLPSSLLDNAYLLLTISSVGFS